MKKSASPIQTVRGGLVDEVVLCDALLGRSTRRRRIDVLTTEPPRAGNPLLEIDLPNSSSRPSTAWASRGARRRWWTS